MTKVEKDMLRGVITNKSIQDKDKIKLISSFLSTVPVYETLEDPIVKEALGETVEEDGQ